MEDQRREEKLLQGTIEDLAAAADSSKGALAELDQFADLIIEEGGPTRVVEYHGGDVVEAADRIEKDLGKLEVIEESGKTAAKVGRDVGKLASKIALGVRKLYSPVLREADEERGRRKDKQ